MPRWVGVRRFALSSTRRKSGCGRCSLGPDTFHLEQVLFFIGLLEIPFLLKLAGGTIDGTGDIGAPPHPQPSTHLCRLRFKSPK